MNFIDSFLLLENIGKINFLINNYKKSFGKKVDGGDKKTKVYNDEEIKDIITKVYNVDLTGGKYCKWILDNLLKLNKEQLDRFLNEDLEIFKTDLNLFHNKIKEDINKFNSISEFNTFVFKKQSENKISSRKYNLEDFKNDPNITLEYSDSKVIIIRLLNEESAIKYGKGTKWCTSSIKNNMFDHYNDDGSLYIYYDIFKNKKYQLHFGSNQFMDESDSPIDINILNLNLSFFKEKIDNDLYILNERINNYKGGNFTLPNSIFINKIIKLSNLKNLIVTGTFDCSDRNLTNLEGCPTSVYESYVCNNNKLTSLEGCPSNIDGDFICSHNNLKNLKFSPTNIKGDFYCSSNINLNSLEGGPTNVGGNFSCGHNPNLTSLKFSPIMVGGKFFSAYCSLTSLEGCPNIINGSFYCSYNKLTSLEGCPSSVGGSFFCYDNPGNFTDEDVKIAQENRRKKEAQKNESYSKFNQFYNLIMENIKNSRYSGFSGKDIRGIKQHGSQTRYRTSALYKRGQTRGMNGQSGGSMINKSRKSNVQLGIHKGQGGILKNNHAGKRSTKKVGKRLNSKTPFIVSHLMPNGDVVVKRSVRQFIDKNKMRKFSKSYKDISLDFLDK